MIRSSEGWGTLSHDPQPGAEQQGTVTDADIHHHPKDRLGRASAHGWGSGSVPAKKKKNQDCKSPWTTHCERLKDYSGEKSLHPHLVHILSAANICHCHRQGHPRTAISALYSYHEKSWRWDRSWGHESFHSEWNQQDHISERADRIV